MEPGAADAAGLELTKTPRQEQTGELPKTDWLQRLEGVIVLYLAVRPSVSATYAPRFPMGAGGPWVVSTAV